MSDDIEVLIVDDDHDVVEAYQELLEIAGFKAKTVTDPTLVLEMLKRNWPG